MQNTENAFPPDLESGYNRKFVWPVCAIAALGGLLFGYDWIVVSGSDLFYEKFFNLTLERETAWAKSCALVGCLMGALIAGGLSDRFGRKRLLILSAAVFAISSVGTGLANTFGVFVLWRILGGTAIGLASNLSPTYIAEISPAAIRGRLVSMNQLTIVIGIVIAQFVNWQIAEPVPPDATTQQILDSWNGQFGWRWMFAATAVPSLLFFVGMWFVPESPRWLVKDGQHQKAGRILAWVGGEAHATRALAEIQATLVNETGRVNYRALLDSKMLRILTIGVILAVFQQWCGINVIFYYAKVLFADAGYPVSEILLQIVIIGLANLLFTFVAIFTVDRLGRRVLMLAGPAGLAVIYVLMGLSYHFEFKGLPVVILTVGAIACYACTLAPVIWVVLSEIFPNRIRGAAVSVAVFSLWTACFILTYTFPLLRGWLGPAKTFWIYGAICVAGFIFILAKLPETKGKTLEEIERELVD